MPCLVVERKPKGQDKGLKQRPSETTPKPHSPSPKTNRRRLKGARGDHSGSRTRRLRLGRFWVGDSMIAESAL